MKATNKLRFVERKVYVSKPAYNSYGHQGEVSELVKKTILQQWWETSSMGTMSMGFGDPMPLGEVTGEWRDVPVEVDA
jgi:hypothetical protein